MKILNPHEGFLSDAEVLRHLRDTKKRYTDEHLAHGAAAAMKPENVGTVLKEVMDYLETAPAATQEERHMEAFMEQIAKFKGLEKVEVLQILNLRPTEIAMLDCIIEEMDVRFSEAEQTEMLEVVKNTLPPPPKEEMPVEPEKE